MNAILHRRLAVLGVLLLWTAACASRGGERRKDGTPGTVAFVGVQVIPMTGDGTVLRDRTVLVRGDRIAAVGPRDEVEIPAGALRIDGAGRTLMPGLADLHVHLEYFDDPDLLALFLANGVTTVRNMDGRPHILEWRRRIASGELAGPTIVTAGPLLDGDPPLLPDNTVVKDAAQAAAAVIAQAKAGYDFIKVYTNLSPEAWTAILEAARERGLPIAGHVPREVGIERVLTSGQTSLEHLDGYDDLIEADDSPFRSRWHWAKLYMGVPTDAEKVRRAAEQTAAAKVWNVPTLVEKEKVAPLEEMVGWLDRPEMRYLPPAAREAWDPRTWDPRRARLVTSMGEEEREILTRGRQNRLALVRALHDAGAGLLVGTDTPQPFVLPGFAVLEEVRLFVEAGLPPEAALAAATREAGRFLGKDFGTVEPGRRADLLLLEANPLEDVAVLARRAGVMVRGRWMPEADLRALLDRLASRYAP
ncbi:MAG TPA: amidohydrolase family protein [Thermoanaerobaculia bacterium]|nr:amidohydrolase family protein [Thermoanaerobaculia bacterium]